MYVPVGPDQADHFGQSAQPCPSLTYLNQVCSTWMPWKTLYELFLNVGICSEKLFGDRMVFAVQARAPLVHST